MSGYSGDITLTKGPVINGFSLAKGRLKIGSLLFKNLKANKKNCAKVLIEEVYATHKAYELVRKGVPFCDAHKQVGMKYAGKSQS